MISLINEVALRIDDITFKDFNESIYEKALLRSNRIIAKKYDILQKVYSFTLNSVTDDTEKDGVIDLEDFNKEILVDVNDRRLTKVGLTLTDYGQYYIRLVDRVRYFNYKTENKNLEDEITIVYTVLPTETDDYKTEFIIPDKYQEELIEETILYLSKIGMARFQAEKKQKYIDLFKVADKSMKANPLTTEHTQFAVVQPHKWWC